MRVTQWKKPVSLMLAVAVASASFFMTTSTIDANEVNYESYSGFTTSEVPVLPETEAHPSLWFKADEVADVYDKRNADEYALELWNNVKGSKYLGAALPEVPTYPNPCVDSRLHSYYGDMARIAKYNAFMYVMEGDETHKNAAIGALLRAYDGPIYQCDPTVSSSPVDETYRGVWIQNFAEAYDWMHGELTAEQDAAIRTAFAKEAQELNDFMYIWGPRPHNHRSKPAWGLGTAALALSGHEDAAEWLQTALEAANTNTKYFFSSDGVYREGSQYYIYSHLNFLPFLYHYKHVSEVDLFPTYKPAFIWEFSVTNNKGWMPNVEDSYLRHNFLQMVAGQFVNDADSTPLHPTAKWGNLFQWRYETTDTAPWGGEFGNNTGASYDDTMDLNKYLTYDPSVEPIAPTGSATQFLNEGGQTIFRNHWNDDPSSRYLLFHGQAEMDNHNQFDHLSFIIHAENQMMASDSGYSKSAYGDAERRSWYRTAKAHNTVTLNGAWPVDTAQNVTPASRFGMDTGFFDFQQKEARFIAITNDTTKGENPLLFPPDDQSTGYIKRSVAFPNQEYFVVADQLSTKDGAAGQFELYLHGGRGTMIGDGNYREWIYSKDAYGTAAKLSAWILSDDATLTNHVGDVSYIKDDAASFGYVTAQKQASNANFLQILIPNHIQADTPVVTDASDESRTGGTVAMNGNLDTYLVQNESSMSEVGELSSDAEFGYVRHNGWVQQYAMKQGTSISYGDELLAASSAPVALALNVAERDRHSGYITSVSDAYTLQLLVPEGKTVASASLAGEALTASVSNGYVTLALSGSGELEIQYVDEGAGDVTAPLAITDVNAVNEGANAAILSWTAPADQGSAVSYYDVRYSVSPITEQNWSQASQVAGEPVPGAPGTPESMVIGGLSAGTTYYIAVKSGDHARNVSALSNVAAVTMGSADDTIPPAAITDLTISSVSSNTASLTWSAPGDDGYKGTAVSYDLRYSTSPIDEASWSQAVQVQGEPVPLSVGNAQGMTVEGLKPGLTYFFAIRSSDEANNESTLSNLLFVPLLNDPAADKLQPAQVTASADDGNVPANTVDGDMTTRWSARSDNGVGQWIAYDLGQLYQVDYVKLAWSSGHLRQTKFEIEASIDGNRWSTVTEPAWSSGKTEKLEAYEAGVMARYIRIVGYGNTASGWNSLLETEIYGRDAAEAPPVLLSNVELKDRSGETISSVDGQAFVQIEAVMTNTRQESQEAALTVGVYDGQGKLLNTVFISGFLNGLASETIGAELELPSGADSVKLFVWDSWDGMTPLSEAVQID
ncbi:discoidin domain-containing protein [Paenibacillus sp. PL2-23]|uniref:discoidin domain-containing protein n=1 Tax=Paenibacillus sp. PL2-23 TaxID=2100729 RepID=UPI0030FB036F